MDRSKIGIVVGLSAEARLLRRRGFMLGIGGGLPAGAGQAAKTLISNGAEALISFGLAGGLNPRLRPGALLIPRTVIDDRDIFLCNAELVALLGGFNTNATASAQAIAGTSEDKKAIFERTHADAIDLESGAVARAAEAANIPFAVLRAVADPAERDLPAAALIALNATGQIRFISILASVLKNPAQIPALLALAQEAAKARAALVGKLKELG